MDQSPFPLNDEAVKAEDLVGKKFFSPHNKGAYLAFTEQDGMLFVSEFKNDKAIQPWQTLNCGEIAKIDGITRGLSCTINPYGLEKDRTGSASIDFAVYDVNGKPAVSPLFDYELKAWETSGADLMFHNWTAK